MHPRLYACFVRRSAGFPWSVTKKCYSYIPLSDGPTAVSTDISTEGTVSTAVGTE